MHIGIGVVLQNLNESTSDAEVYRNELQLAEMAETLGFDSIWGVEHHFTDYAICPDVIQFLTYLAGRTTRIQLASSVVVLPWHNPLRVAEQVLMLDHLSRGRAVLGIGRGLGRIEYEGFGIDMAESRKRFIESAQMILRGLESGSCELDGELIKQVRRDLRPAPFKTFQGRSYAASVSPETARIVAELGVGMLVIPQKQWEMITADLTEYRAHFQSVHGRTAPPPRWSGSVFCDEDPERARELATRYIGRYYQSSVAHYEMASRHLERVPGYEAYRLLHQVHESREGLDAMIAANLELQVCGTPDACVEKILHVREQLGADGFTGLFSYGGMPYAEAKRSMELFARKVIPEVKGITWSSRLRVG